MGVRMILNVDFGLKTYRLLTLLDIRSLLSELRSPIS
jgi:hypothetical protein